MCTKCFYKCVKQTYFACLISHLQIILYHRSWILSNQSHAVVERRTKLQTESCRAIIFTCGSALPTAPSVSITHTHTHSCSSLMLRAPSSAAFTQPCPWNVNRALTMEGPCGSRVRVYVLFPFPPPSGQRGRRLTCQGSLRTAAEESGRSSLWEKTPWAACDPKPPLTSAWFSPRLVLLPLIWACSVM